MAGNVVIENYTEHAVCRSKPGGEKAALRAEKQPAQQRQRQPHMTKNQCCFPFPAQVEEGIEQQGWKETPSKFRPQVAGDIHPIEGVCRTGQNAQKRHPPHLRHFQRLAQPPPREECPCKAACHKEHRRQFDKDGKPARNAGCQRPLPCRLTAPAPCRPPADENQHHHQGIGLKGTAGKNPIGQEQVKGQSQKRFVQRQQVTGEQEEEEPARHPKQRGVDAGNPQPLTKEAVGCGNQRIQQRRFEGGIGGIGAQGDIALPVGNAGRGLIIHAARFDGREQLTGGVKIERQVGQVGEANGQPQAEQKHQHECQRPPVWNQERCGVHTLLMF